MEDILVLRSKSVERWDADVDLEESLEWWEQLFFTTGMVIEAAIHAYPPTNERVGRMNPVGIRPRKEDDSVTRSAPIYDLPLAAGRARNISHVTQAKASRWDLPSCRGFEGFLAQVCRKPASTQKLGPETKPTTRQFKKEKPLGPLFDTSSSTRCRTFVDNPIPKESRNCGSVTA